MDAIDAYRTPTMSKAEAKRILEEGNATVAEKRAAWASLLRMHKAQQRVVGDAA